MRRRRVIWGSVVVAAIVAAAALVWFEPWKLWTNHRVHDALPAVAVLPAPGSTSAAPPSRTPSAAAAVDTLLSRGTFRSHEHSTHGAASIVRRADGTLVLAIAGLHTSEGPDVKVWLTDRRVTGGDWHSFDDGLHVNLGHLKGNLGDQVYAIPPGTDLSKIVSVDIWCDRFNVSFGAAPLTPVQ